MPEQQPRLIAGRYELIAPIGRGTMGTVWRAFDRSLTRVVAIKQIRQDPALSRAQREELRERLLREGRSAARVIHPSVATIHDAIEAEGNPWIIMELVEGRSLEQVIEEEGPLPPRMVAQIGYDLLGALRTAHAQGILHRDVKPGNVLLTDSGRVVLTDFGIAKAAGDSPLTQTGMVIGSPGYTAPERARGDYTGPESDMWSLGATLYFAVEGRPAYERASLQETLAALMSEAADPPTQAGPLRPVLDGLLNKDHTVRLSPERAATMLRAAAATPSTRAPEAGQPEPSKPGPSKPGSSKPGPSQPGAVQPGPSRQEPSRPQPGEPRPATVQPTSGRPPAERPAQPAPSRPAGEPRGPAVGDDEGTRVIRRLPTGPPPGLRRTPGPPPTPAPRPPVPGSSVPGSPVPRPPVPGSAVPGSAVPGEPGDEAAAPGRARPRTPFGTPQGHATPPVAPGAPAVPGAPGVPGAPSVPGAPGAPGDGGPQRGLGTDLFSMQGNPSRPETDHRTRALVVAAGVIIAFILLTVLAMAAFAADVHG
ncbi:hypothetical protein Pth03_13740 [Planotetraspora thailandica]|uniref:non-specific serine/threonine protein kinase n=1 Tax=Planotetraspora thailandica TaxID=487172 RepID=A0A8J3XUC8_9ACTN|nr:serine/threonine-protein kinase [Planotetraspora thailandica]GII52985.1 hypothetical protein Pth03_13740 [Planotetraspora thailandica]